MHDSISGRTSAGSTTGPSAVAPLAAAAGRGRARPGERRSGRFPSAAVRSAAVALTTAGVLAVGAAAASATALNGPTGPLAAGAAITASLSGTASLGRTAAPATCTTGTLGATVGAVGPQLPLTAPVLELGSCTGPQANTSPVSFRGLSLQAAGGAEVRTPSAAAGYDGDLRLTSASFFVSFSPRSAPTSIGRCVFSSATVTGHIRNSDRTVTFPNVTPSGGVGACIYLLPGGFSATFGGLTSGGAPVTVSPTP